MGGPVGGGPLGGSDAGPEAGPGTPDGSADGSSGGPAAGPAWRLAGYTEIRELGAGAQGRVVLARDDFAGEQVAIKYLARHEGDGTAVARLREEAAMLAQVTDPHVVRLLRFESGEQGAALVMEAVNGVSLKRVLAEHGALEPEAALAVLKGSLLGLAAAHGVGVVHRDYKPANVVVRADGLSKLIDFGIAALAGDASRSGTPAYMAPEQWRGEPSSPATDVYAATCVFFECVTGRRPYGPGSLAETRDRHLNAPAPVDDVPEPLRPLLERGLAKSAWDRPPGASAFVGELEEAASAAYGPDWEQRGVRALAVAAAALAALFPLGAAVVGTGAAAGSAAAGSAASGTAAAAGGGLLASTGAKVALAVGTAAVVATGGGTAAYIASDDGPGDRRTRNGAPSASPAAAVPVSAISALNRTTPLPGRPALQLQNAQYVQVSGIADPALRTRVNAALRAPLDRRVDQFRAYVAGPHTSAVDTPRCARLTSRVSIRYSGPRLISVRHLFERRTCNVVDEGLPYKETVTVDLRTGRALGPADVFRDLGPSGISAIARTVPKPPPGKRDCVQGPLKRADLEPAAAAGGLVQVQLSFARDGLELNYAGWVECGDGLVLTVPYARVTGLLRPGLVPALPAAAPPAGPSPSRT
ncbi:serine/threonine-protein kinase [Actinomadura yumaensis]|uniref:serine/threonine-protein kinase n=1 Tax=Actinomadura yumaensis TaxID=111807 RepID=UPI003611848E